MAVSFAGILVLGLIPGCRAAAGTGLCLASALALALGSVLMRGLEGVHPFGLQAWGALISLPVMLAASLALEGEVASHLRQAPVLAYAAAAYSALFASIFGHGLYFWLVRRHGVSAVTPHLLLTPLLAVLLGVLFWGDRPGPAPSAWRRPGAGGVLAGLACAGAHGRGRGRRPE